MERTEDTQDCPRVPGGRGEAVERGVAGGRGAPARGNPRSRAAGESPALPAGRPGRAGGSGVLGREAPPPVRPASHASRCRGPRPVPADEAPALGGACAGLGRCASLPPPPSVASLARDSPERRKFRSDAESCVLSVVQLLRGSHCVVASQEDRPLKERAGRSGWEGVGGAGTTKEPVP